MENNDETTTDVFTSDIADDNKPGKSLEKKQITTNNFRMNKKLAQGIKVLCSNEKKEFEEIVTTEPSKNLIVIHFGNGEETDHVGLENFLQKFGQNTLHIFPGNTYGFIEFPDVESAKKVIETSIKVPDNMVANSCEVKFEGMLKNVVRNVFFFYSKLTLAELAKAQQTDLPNAAFSCTLPGLKIIKDFVSVEEEQNLIKEIDQGKWHTLANRRVQHYGYEFVYGINTIDKNKHIGDFPDYCNCFKAKLMDITKEHNQPPMDQLTINDYFPGQGIPPHVDTHSPFEECMVSLSLGSGTVMTFKNQHGEQRHVFIPPRSMMIFSGEARFAWYHSIALRKLDRVEGKLYFRRRRISLTFRKVKHTPCTCAFPFYCDSQGGLQVIKTEEPEKKKKAGEEGGLDYAEEIKIEHDEAVTDDSLKATDLEKKYVYNTYEKIAPHFSHTRYKPWPKIEEFLNKLPNGSIVADIGCGNGKYLGVNPNLIMLGTDRSENLLEIAKTRDIKFQVFSADSLRLPIKDERVDCVISIAVIHHFSNKHLRIQAINEFIRITKPGGIVLIYVWALEQEGRKFTNQDVLVPWHLQYKFEEEDKLNSLINGSGDTSKEEIKEVEKSREEDDVILDENRKTVVYKRYYHMFKHGELEELIKECPELDIEESFYDHANWVVRCKKINKWELI